MEKINLSIQVVPVNHSDSYSVVDKAIEVIQKSGLKYIVGPFQTSIEGTFEELMGLISEIKKAAHEAGSQELLLNIQIHAKDGEDVSFESKTAKYD